MFVGTNAMSVRGGRSVAAAVSAMTAITAAMAVMTTTTTPSTGAVTLDSVAVRLGLPEGRGLSGVCLFRSGPDKRRRVMFKSVASARKKYGGGGGDYMVAGDLAADRVYEGTFSRLVDGDQVARFGCDGGRRFEVATPFVVPESDLDTILAVKESMERRFGAQPSRRDPQRSVTAEHVSVTLRGLRPSFAETGMDAAAAAITVDVFQLYKKPPPPPAAASDPWDAAAKQVGAVRYSAYPYARYALRYPVSDLVLADLPPDQMMAVKIRRSAPVVPAQPQKSDVHANRTENAIFIYTGGLYPRGTANLTDMLDERSAGRGGTYADEADVDVAATSYQIDAKRAHSDSYDILKNTVKCYTDGMVYNGYPCRNSDVCIPLGWLCDSQKDCLEGDDEYNCYNTVDTNGGDNTNGVYNNNDNWYYTRGTCKKYEFRCRSRRMSVCLPNSWLCDGRLDCDDGWDENEFNCGRTYSGLRPGIGDFNAREDQTCLTKNNFKCWQGTGCIGLRAVCDGIKDCADGSDERVCDNWSSHCDRFTEFRCLNNFNTYNARSCIPRQWVCDLQDDCPHGEDETVTSCLGMDHPTFNGLETDIDDF
ncbi:uncharacterized protein LOC114131583 [Aphis gossypii]|uniref:uncharacterized protein LOC114131583 n=1 Tax=Aphis gossypii TaxID=80765 RepID=UPI002159AC78|nr:uncharacterized protein LOC114131583 [Aphis gossypii]